MTPIDAYLSDLADQAGITIEYAHLRDGRDGEYVHERKLIRLRRGMSARKHRSVLAHELAHAAYGHTPTHFGPVHSKQERQADAWAARILIDLDDYRHLEVVHEGHPGAIAVDLGVMRSIVIAFQQTLSRIGQTTYVQPRMGAGGWAERIEIRESA